jgi:hypothetical protein
VPHPFAFFAKRWARCCLKETIFVASVGNPAYDKPMAKAHKFDLENPAPILDDEDEETLAAIDEGIRDAEAGRVVPAEKARELLPKWKVFSPASIPSRGY